MAIKNVIIGSEPKTRKPYTKKVKPEIMESKKSKAIVNPAWDFMDEANNIDLLIAGKKLLWKKIYQVYQIGIKKRFNPNSDLYFKDYISPKFYVYNKKNKQIIFEVDGNMGQGFLKLIAFMNEL